jgi:DNA repair ATPase RecN
MLQFCHLALRTQQEEGVLDEQRRNLQAIESTAGDIRTLVGKLPPDEQRKAQLIVDQMNSALDKQGRVVGHYIERTDEAQKDLSTHTIAMEKGLASVEGELSGLRSLPMNLKNLEDAVHHIDETTTSFDAPLGDLRARLSALDAKLDMLLARPICPIPSPGASAKIPSPATPAASAHARGPADAEGGKDTP